MIRGMFTRATGRLSARTALCVLACVLAGCKHTPQERSASFHEIMVADVNPATHGQRFQNTATVTYSDPEWHLLFFQDSADAVYLEPPAGVELRSGDRVRIEGTSTDPGKLLQDAKVTILERGGSMPPAIRLKSASEMAKYPSKFVELEGTVRWSGIRFGRATLEVFAGDHLLRALVFPGTSEDLPRIGSEVRIAGVSAPDYDKQGSLETLQLLTPSVRQIQVLKAGPTEPFGLPLTGVYSLKSIPVGALVHVSGRMSERADGFLLQEGAASVPVSLHKALHGDFGEADVAGFWTGNGLADAMIRPEGELSARAGDIRTISELKRLTVAEAAAQRRVSVKGVVTYWDPYWHLLFVQDSTDAIFVGTQGSNFGLRAGDLVDVNGVTSQGDYAPVIAASAVSFVRRGSFPQPIKLDLVQENLAEADSRWCTFRGVVHTARVHDGHTILKLGAGETALDVELPTLIKGDELIDKEISATGALGILFNERRQAVGHQIFVPAPEFLTVVSGGGHANPATQIFRLRRYEPDFDERHRVQISGTVVLKEGNNAIFVQDPTAGIQVRTTDPVAVSDGDQVSVWGFLLPGEYSPVLEDAVVERQSSSGMPPARQITPKAAQEGPHDSEYVSMRGTLSAVRSSPNGLSLLLNDGGTYFEAVGPASNELESMRLGSQIEVRGICRIVLDRGNLPFSIRGFTLTFDSPASVAVLHLGPWWDAHRVRWAFLLIAIIATSVGLWATVLRQQVRSKTAELQLSLEAKRKAQQFDVARNEVLESIARNAPLPESMERLALAIEEQVTGGKCVVVLPPDGKSFLNGRPSPVLIAPSVPEDLHHEILPVLAEVLLPPDGGLLGHGAQNDPDLLSSLLTILRRGGLTLATGQITVVFSASGIAEGLLILFWKDAVPVAVETVQSAVLQSASRLVSLANDHWQMHERLLHEARHDGLTGLPNRMVAEDRLEQALARAARRRKLFAVFCIDLDHFKDVNDELGHDAGDELLRIASSRLRTRIRHSDTLARMGGDEFLAIIEDCAGDSAAQAVAQSLLSALQEPVTLEDRQLKISGSVGVAMYPADGKNASQLRRNADQAMYCAKSRGGNTVSFWSSEPTPSGKASQKTSSKE